METIANSYEQCKEKYDSGECVISDLFDISLVSLAKLNKECSRTQYTRDDTKEYFIFTANSTHSPPINSNLWIEDVDSFTNLWGNLIKSINPQNHCIKAFGNREDLDRVLYTAIISFSACYDLWKSSSRKTPGTYFEILLGSILAKILPTFSRGKFISIPQTEEEKQNKEPIEKVSTDIVFDDGQIGIVIPAKITTRERIVQPYAHQRILDSVFKAERYQSVLMCVSETQADHKKQKVNDICVPGTIKLFQKHLASISGIYYLDPPLRYCSKDITEIVTVSNYSQFFTKDLGELVKAKN